MSDSTITGTRNQAASATTWNGAATTLQVNQQVFLPQTPDGTVFVAALNAAANPSQAEIVLTSGGGAPTMAGLPAFAALPWVETANFHRNNLSITNISAVATTPVLVEAVGPGIPGVTPVALPDGTPVALGPGQGAQGATSSPTLQLLVQATGPTTAVVGVIGGPSAGGTNGKVIAVSATANTGPGGPPPPSGYYATTTANEYSLTFSGDGQPVFVANLSFSATSTATVTLRAI